MVVGYRTMRYPISYYLEKTFTVFLSTKVKQSWRKANVVKKSFFTEFIVFDCFMSFPSFSSYHLALDMAWIHPSTPFSFFNLYNFFDLQWLRVLERKIQGQEGKDHLQHQPLQVPLLPLPWPPHRPCPKTQFDSPRDSFFFLFSWSIIFFLIGAFFKAEHFDALMSISNIAFTSRCTSNNKTKHWRKTLQKMV